MGTGDLTEPTGPVSVGTVYERFPASVRGAVVVRGLDREPHQIRLLSVRVVHAHDLSKEVHRAAVAQTTIDVAPHGEVLLPFDVPFTDLMPGWFSVVADVEVDGSLRMTGPEGGGKRFGVPWPAEDVRKLDLKPSLKLGGAIVERIRSTVDATEIRWRPPRGGEDADLRVSAGRHRLPAVQSTTDARAGVRTTITHPLARGTDQLTVELVRGRDRASASLPLP